MPEPSSRKPDDVTVLPARKRGGNPLMARGKPSLNPNGRPKIGQSLAEALREHFSPTTIIELAEKLLRSDDDRVRMVALEFIATRGYGKPATTQLDVDANKPPALPPNWHELPPAQRMAYLEALRSRAALPSPAITDEESE